jgi:hypothetical protein
MMKGHGGSDLLIGGTTDFDANFQALVGPPAPSSTVAGRPRWSRAPFIAEKRAAR